MSVIVLALVLSSCILPQPKTPPSLISISPTTITAYSGQPFNLAVTAGGGGGISKIVATFEGSTVTKTSNPATFTFTAPTVIAESLYPLGITVYGKNGLTASATETVDVAPLTSVGSITYAVRLNNPYPYVYTYPAQNNNQSVIFTVNVGNGANAVGGVSVYVDNQPIPASPTTLSSVLKATIAGTSFVVQKSFVALYSISANHVGPHTFWVNFYGNAGQLIGSSEPGNFYITYPAVQKVTLSAATPLYNTNYINGLSGVSFTAGATDYTSQYEGFLINGTPFATYVNVATAVSVLNKSYSISVPASALTSPGSTTFMFKDKSIDGSVASESRTYVVVKATPVLRASYKGIQSSGNTLYVGVNPTTFQVYAYDPYWMTSSATLGTQPFSLTQNGTVTADVSGLSNGATESFTAKVVNYANLSSTLNLTIVRVAIPPVIHYANLIGLSSSPVSYAASGTITVVASVTSPYLSSVTLNLQTDGATTNMYSLTQNSTGLWTTTVNTANLLPGTYKSWISAEDLALNVATALTSPATVNVYRPIQDVFTTSLETTPSAPVNGYVKSATITANVNPNWIYAMNKVYLYNGTTVSASQTGNYTSTYAFTISASGTYKVVILTNADQRATQIEAPYVVKIDNSTPTVKLPSTHLTADASSITILGTATDVYSGISQLTLSYQTLGATGADNGAWVTIGSTSANNATSVSYDFLWKNLNTLPDGKYNIKLVATSGVGNTGTAMSYVVNNNAGAPNVAFTPSSTLVFTNKATQTVSFTVNNESDVAATLTFSKPSSTVVSSATFVSNSYTAYPYTKSWTYALPATNATYTYTATVTDMADQAATHSTVFVYDTTAPTATLTAATGTIYSYGKYVAAAGTPVTFTIEATDNLSGIKSVVVNGTQATLKTISSTGLYGQTLSGTYTVTLDAPTSSGTWTVTATVTDNAGNQKATALQIWVDAVKPTISVSFYKNTSKLTPLNGYVYSGATPTVVATVYGYELTVKATYATGTSSGTPLTPSPVTSTPASYVTFKATHTNTKYTLTVLATDGLNKLSNSNTTAATVVIGTASPTVTVTLQTNPATIPYNHMNHFINLEYGTPTYIATIVVKDPNSIPIQTATFYVNGNPYQFISGGSFVSQPGLNVVSSALVNGGITAATLTLNLNNTPYVSTTGLYSLTASATDYALNGGTTSSATSFYYDVTKPVLQPNNTLYKSGNFYYFDLGFSERMATLTNKSVAASIVTFQLSNGLTYTSNPASQEFVPVTSYNTGLLHIWGLKTTSGSPVNVLPLAGNTVTITVGASYISAGGNPVAGPVTVTFTNVSAPKPVNP